MIKNWNAKYDFNYTNYDKNQTVYNIDLKDYSSVIDLL